MTVGSLGEDLVEQHYKKLGYKLVERNYIFPHGRQMGEIDLIVSKQKELVFVEVKARRSNKFGSGLDAVDIYKQRKLVRTAKLFLKENTKYQSFDYRIDVAIVDIDKPNQNVIIIPNAIEDLD
jgi:putative endonuclease